MLLSRFAPLALIIGFALAVPQAAHAALGQARAPEPLPTPAIATSATNGTTSAADATTTPACCQPCITYRHRGPKLCCDCCQAPIQTVLKVKNPCECCDVDVPVCLPGCCTGEPKVCCTCGFLGRPVVEYQWCCGYTVRVAFRHSGDLLVTTWGR